MEQGTVKWFNDTRGFGFILRGNGGDVFVSHTAIRSEGRPRTLKEGQTVQFDIVKGPQGWQAENVQVCIETKHRRAKDVLLTSRQSAEGHA